MTVSSTWTDPSTMNKATNAILPSADFNKVLSNLKALGGSSGIIGCRLGKTVDQSIGSSSETAITFDGEAFDPEAMHDGGSPTRITIPAGYAGRYAVFSHMMMAATTATEITLHVRLNGSTGSPACSDRQTGRGAYQTQLNAITGAIALTSGDYLESYIKHDAAAAVTMVIDSNYSGEMGVVKVG